MIALYPRTYNIDTAFPFGGAEYEWIFVVLAPVRGMKREILRGAENAKISFGNRLTRVKRGYIIQSVESEISFFSVVKFAYANRCERESGNQSVSTVAKRHLFLRK